MNGLCSHERLELALVGSLDADAESTLHLHLDDCALCAAEMERLAGGEQASREIAAMLVPDDLDDALPLREECSTADFVVDHLEPSDDPAVLGRLGGYDVLDIIGRGGMGVVLKGFDRELKRFVAIKALAPHLAHSALARKRFAREAQAAAAVVNLHVIAIHQVQPNGQLPFLVMPLLTGESLAQRLKARGTLELNEILRIGMQAAEGLAAAHGQGLIHRDVKPANILLEKGVERAVLTDFGLARAADDVSMTRWGIIAGTPEYMSPEQARGEALDGRSDLFSLGCVLYEMATGVSPFRTDSTMATLRRIVDEQPAAMASFVPELPPWFSHIVERLLSKDPARRFASASEVSQLLEQCLSHLQQPTSVPLPASLVPHAAGRRSIFNVTRKGVFAMLGTIGMTLLGMVLWQATEAPDISGQWTSDEWGTVVLEAKQPGQYEGTFTGSGKGKSGTVHLKWSRVERRFNGTWRKDVDPFTDLSLERKFKSLPSVRGTRETADDRSGKISLRLVDNAVRGAWTTDKDAQLESGTPRLADLLWTRSVVTVPDGGTVLLGGPKTTSEAAKSATGLAETNSSDEKPVAKPDWVVALDFNYTLLHQRYAMMRISSDGKMESLFPGWRLLRTQLSPEELSALVALVAKNPSVQSRPLSKAAEYAQAVTRRLEPEGNNKLKMFWMFAVVHNGELLELDLDLPESDVVMNQLLKLVGLAAIGGSDKLPKLVDLANSELKRKYPDVSNKIDHTQFRFAIVDHPSGNISVSFNDPGSKNGQVVLRIPQVGQPSIEKVDLPGEGNLEPESIPSYAPKQPVIRRPNPFIERPKLPETGAERTLPPAGAGLRVNVPALGPTPLALDFAFPGNPVHPKLADDRYAKSGVPLAEQTWPMPPWGAEKGGLSAGIRVIDDARIGGEVKAELWVRNSGAKDVTFSQCHRADVGLSVVAKDKDGKEHSADITQFRGLPIFSHWLLPPGHIVKVKEFTLKLGSRKNDELERGWVSLDLPPGDYKLRVKWSDSHALMTHAGDWTGELTTDEVDLKIAAANAGADAGKPAAKPPGENIVKVPDDQYVKSGIHCQKFRKKKGVGNRNLFGSTFVSARLLPDR